ncbi:Translation elongation factor EF1B, beta/delta subunit, guanine nucleotide exchange [Cynara cardunculus var. scolymus]|uniref:Translation elongation factor EF1B, beta/delta subunit, guanine nucleotide exchange n=1 Tax=Cynara cardunculus var. scolymus TaxID=59895 RepID=A0A103XWH1_CYNCS|nr:Translation elongation factor EF1B, beta/delta subunit, guanine nucleotide exchange [Cynara cardunculus var. scolymus]
MAPTFYVGSEAGLKKLDEYLLSRSYITGYQASKDDLAVHAAFTKPPSPQYVNVTRCGVSGQGSGVVVEGSASFPEDATATPPVADSKASGKSSVLLDVKPWDDETDMQKLEEAVRTKLAAVGYGIKKLQIMMTIVDDLVSVDTLIEERLTVEPINEYVQSCDIRIAQFAGMEWRIVIGLVIYCCYVMVLSRS